MHLPQLHLRKAAVSVAAHHQIGDCLCILLIEHQNAASLYALYITYFYKHSFIRNIFNILTLLDNRNFRRSNVHRLTHQHPQCRHRIPQANIRNFSDCINFNIRKHIFSHIGPPSSLCHCCIKLTYKAFDITFKGFCQLAHKHLRLPRKVTVRFLATLHRRHAASHPLRNLLLRFSKLQTPHLGSRNFRKMQIQISAVKIYGIYKVNNVPPIVHCILIMRINRNDGFHYPLHQLLVVIVPQIFNRNIKIDKNLLEFPHLFLIQFQHIIVFLRLLVHR